MYPHFPPSPVSQMAKMGGSSKACRPLLIACAALFLVALAGCTSPREYISNGFKVGPNYKKPPAPVADEWIDSKSGSVNTTSKDLANWWAVFNDPVLNSLIDQAYN